MARLVTTERRLLSAALERERLVRRSPLEGVHSIDRSRNRLPHSQERLVDPANLAPERRACSGAHSGLLLGLCPLEDAGPTLRESRSRGRAAARAGRGVGAGRHGCGPAHPRWRRDSQTLHRPAQRAPSHSPRPAPPPPPPPPPNNTTQKENIIRG